jgi:hypothetical protein
MIVTRADLATLGFCHKGARPVLARLGVSWLDFNVNGVDSARLEVTDDPMVKRVLQAAQERTRGR